MVWFSFSKMLDQYQDFIYLVLPQENNVGQTLCISHDHLMSDKLQHTSVTRLPTFHRCLFRSLDKSSPVATHTQALLWD